MKESFSLLNNVETKTRCELWLESLKKSAEKTNDMFGTKITVDWRNDPNFGEGGKENVKGSNIINSRSV